ncbi:hypothetical protein NVP2275O_193 [Vibrio phage 2.275.O._10N.286.54.E11]|nr:hypothetical protein NVP2275O_193 [Vibrio phage 2.275.O._10N.286.54.E11]
MKNFTYREVKEYNVTYIVNDIDQIASSTGEYYHTNKLTEKYQPMWDYCYDKLVLNHSVIRDTDFADKHWSLNDDGCHGEHFTTIYCGMCEWFETLSVDEKVTVTLLGFSL